MAYTIKVEKDGELIAEREVSPDAVIALLAGGERAAQPTADAEPRRRGKKGKRGSYKKKLDSEMAQEAARRHPATDQIEEMLLEGMGVAAILEKVEVSAPAVYVIRTRLRKEGRLSE